MQKKCILFFNLLEQIIMNKENYRFESKGAFMKRPDEMKDPLLLKLQGVEYEF